MASVLLKKLKSWSMSVRDKRVVHWLVVGIIIALYVLLFPLLYRSIGWIGVAFSWCFIIPAALFWGLRGGALVAAFGFVLSAVLLKNMGGDLIGGPIGFIFSVAVAAALGRLRDLSVRLRIQLAERQELEETLHNAQGALERRVAERTSDFKGAIEQMQREMAERRQAEEELKKSEEKYRSILENMEEGYWEVDLPGNFTFFNDSLCRSLGYSRDELLGMNNRQYATPEMAARTYRIFNQVYRTGQPVDMVDYEVIAKDGSKIILEGSVSLMRDRKGQPIGFKGVNRDVIKRKQAAEELHKSEERFRAIFEKTAVGILIVDSKTRKYIRANPAFEELSGYSAEELASMSPPDIAFSEDWLSEKRLLEGLHSKKRDRYQIERRYVRKDGGIFWGRITVSLVCDSSGDPEYTVSIVEDITDRKQAQKEQQRLKTQLQQAQKMESIGTLAGGIAHDFNNILGAVIGFTELSLHQTEKGSELRENLSEILNAGNRAKDLVKQILTFSRQVDPEQNLVQVKIIIEEALKLIRASLPTTIEIKQKLDSDSLITGDATQIHQVLMNLCTNAAHAMDTKGGVLEVKLENIELKEGFSAGYSDISPGAYVKLTVSDTGEGIPEIILGQIFDPFFSTKEKGKGTGMGLAVVHGIVSSHGGEIYAYSEQGKGSTFDIFLPAFERRKDPERNPKEAIPTGNERILFVDDEAALVNVGQKTVESLGYEVTTRTSSIEALELFKRRPNSFDLVITDMTMPNMTGEDLAIELMRVRSDIPVILCTGYSARINEQQAIGMGIRAFVLKPLLKHQIARVIRDALDEC